MRLKLTLARPGDQPPSDLLVTVDTTVTVGALATAIAASDPAVSSVPAGELTLRVDGSEPRVLAAGISVADAGLHSGATIHLADAATASAADRERRETVATITVVRGPDAGQEFALARGGAQIGREHGNDVRLSDPLVSKTHARLNVGDAIEIIDLGSANGVLVGGDLVARSVLRTGDVVQLGDTELRVGHQAPARGPEGAARVEFNRSPRIDVVYDGEKLPAPEVPRITNRPRFPWIPMLAPVVLGCVLFAITQNVLTVLFVALSPLMMLGNVIESRVFTRRDLEAATERFRAGLADLDAALDRAAVDEVRIRNDEHPATEVVVTAAHQRRPLLWTRRPDQRGFLELRFGVGTLPSRTTVDVPIATDAIAELSAELRAVCLRHSTVDGVPIVASLRECGSIGVAGPRAHALPVARALAAQLVALHSPAEVVVGAVASATTAPDWEWCKWLPHTASDHSPVAGDHLASSPGSIARLVAALEAVLDARSSTREAGDEPPVPAIVIVVEDDAPIERGRLVELAERGRECGIHLLWIAPTREQLPAACRSFADVDANVPGTGMVGSVLAGSTTSAFALEQFDAVAATRLGRSLAPVVDAGARLDDASDLPRSVSLPTLLGPDVARATDAVVDRWRTTNSLPAGGSRRGKDNHLRAVVGGAAGQNLVLDLREQGPHALVGGTTGSGKSEFLQSWVMALALDHSPARVTFLFVDYKGGAAFAECVHLPHSVGLVTDLTPHLVQRALTSLNAELRHREQLLRTKKAKDLLELERRGDPETPPSLVIVVDEFAALVQEVPEFVDGVINIAQRGRSLGLHLILATQRPAGVIHDNLRANTNIRVALRMADAEDSDDVVGSPVAATFDPGLPGRAIAKLGPGRLTPFQSGYVGGWTSEQPPPPVITIDELGFGTGARWEAPEADRVPPPTGPTDLQRLVANVQAAHGQAQIATPRRPWLDPLADVYDLARSPQSRTDAELVFAVADDPAHQRQVAAAFVPDRDGNMAVYGTGGSGKSTFLRTLAITAGLGVRGGPCHVYGLDFGARGLQMLEPLAHVGAIVTADDTERIERLLRTLRQTIDERAARYAAVNAGTVDDYRRLSGNADEPRILLLVDGISAFRQAYELGAGARWFDVFQSIAADGRQVGVHVIVSADREAAVPSALASVVQRRLVLRTASDQDRLMLGVPAGGFDDGTPPGRGFFDGEEVQVLLLGGSANTSRQAAAIKHLAAELERTSHRQPAPGIGRLEERIRLGDLPVDVGGHPVLGIADETLAPIGFVPEEVLLVVGPPQSGKTSVLASIALSLERAKRGDLVYLGAGRSPLRALLTWSREAVGTDAIAAAATELAAEIAAGVTAPSGIFLEDGASFVNSAAEDALLDLIRACRAHGVFLATDSETSAIGSWPLEAAIKASRYGIALQPDQHDGDAVFKTTLPRVARAEFPPGRGFLVRGGRATRFQAALPEVGPA
jgi:S-DNA-T family DNA segregation ATPase FtsK/SpoIIIE